MKEFIILFTLVLSQNMCSQIKTLYTNENHKIIVEFESPIERAIVGNRNFFFAFDSQSKDKMGTLTGIKGKKTNLFIITSDGLNYSFVLEYKSNISNTNFYEPISSKSALNYSALQNRLLYEKEYQLKTDSLQKIEEYKIENLLKNDTIYSLQSLKNASNLYTYDKNKYINKYSKYIINKKAFYQKFSAGSHNINLSLLNIIYEKNEYYFILEINNKSGVDFNINYLNFYKTSLSRKTRNSSQRIELPEDENAEFPIKYNVPKTVKAHTKNRFIYVFEKITLSNKNKIVVRLNELKGERTIELNIKYQDINNPN